MQCIFYGNTRTSSSSLQVTHPHSHTGIVLITVAYGLRVLLVSRDGHFKGRAHISWVMVGATVAMFTIATVEMAFGLLHNLQAFIWYTGPGGAVGEFEDISNWVNVMRTADYVAQTFIGDGIMVGTVGPRPDFVAEC